MILPLWTPSRPSQHPEDSLLARKITKCQKPNLQKPCGQNHTLNVPMCHDEGTLAKYIKIHGYSHDTWMCLKIEHPIFKWPALKNEKKSPIQTAIQCGILASRFRWKPSIAKSVQTSTDLAQRNDKKLLRKLKKLKSLHQFKYLFKLRMQDRSLASKCVLSFARRLYNFLSPCQV